MRRVVIMTGLGLTGGSACRPAIDAPDDVEAMVVFGFVNFPSDGHVEAISAPMFAWSEERLTDLAEGYAVNQLTAADLSLVGVASPDIAGIIGALGRATYTSDPRTVAEGITHPHKDELYSGTTAFSVLSEAGSRDCFLDGDCDTYGFVAEETSVVPVLGTNVRTVTAELLWIDSTPGAEVLAMRQLVPEPTQFASPLLAIDQQYGLTLVRASGAGSERLETFWVDARVLGLELPEGFAVRQAVGRMQTSADDLDAWASGL